MKRFLVNITTFFLAFLGIIILLVICTTIYTNKTFSYTIPKHKNILVTGNSHPECAINDALLPNVYNIAQSGTGYFYDYLKVREITKHNTQIDTVVIGYSYGDLNGPMDSWFSGEDRIVHKLPDHFFLLQWEDYLDVLEANPWDVILNTPKVILHNIKMKQNGYANLGGYKPLNENRLATAIKNINEQIPDMSEGRSKYQMKYLRKIYEYCVRQDIQVILLNTPVYPLLEEIQEPMKAAYCNFAENELSKALLINHSNYPLPDEAFRDLGHLHSKGATMYSNYLSDTNFKVNFQECK